MASIHPTAAVSPLFPTTRERLTLLLLIAVSLISVAIAVAALQRPATLPAMPAPAAPAPITQAPIVSLPPVPISDTRAQLLDDYQQLHYQRLAAEQAARAGATEAHEIATAGAEALQSRIATRQGQFQAEMDRDRALFDAYQQLAYQRLAAEQALRAGHTENYEIATSGADALLSRIAALQGQRP